MPSTRRSRRVFTIDVRAADPLAKSGQHDSIPGRIRGLFQTVDNFSIEWVRNAGDDHPDRMRPLRYQAARNCANEVALFCRDSLDPA